MRLRAGAATDRGRVRGINEDAFLSRPDQGLFVVCDGMGGEAAGEVASGVAVQVVGDSVDAAEHSTDGYLAQTSRLAAMVRRANRSILDEAQGDASKAGMGTTLVGALIANDIASIAHVGDSRAYLWREGALEPLTTDHSLVEAEVRAGLVARADSVHSEHQNVLLRALGREEHVDVELNEVPIKAGDALLLCSDGLTRMVSEGAIAQVLLSLRDPQEICDRLIASANDAGGVDNITVIVVEVADEGWGQVWNRWRR